MVVVLLFCFFLLSLSIKMYGHFFTRRNTNSEISYNIVFYFKNVFRDENSTRKYKTSKK